MAISFVGSAVGSSSPNAGTSVDLTTISGLTTNDLIIVAAGVGDTANNGLAAPTEGGYTDTAVDLYSDDTADTNLDIYYKFHNGTDTTCSFGAVGGTNASNAAVVMVFRGVALVADGGPFDTAVSATTGIDTADADPPSHNWSGAAGVWTVIAMSAGMSSGATASATFPTGYTTNAAQRTHNDSIDLIVGVGYKESPSDPEDPGAFTVANQGASPTSNAWAAATMSLKPAAAGQEITGVVLTVTPSLPTGALTHTITGVALTVTPTLPTGQVTGVGQQVDGVVLTVTPSLPTGSLTHSLTGTVLTATPSLPVGTLNHSLTGVVLTVTPSLPTGTLNHGLTGTVLTVTPTLPTGALAHSITGVVLTATPELPVGQVTTPGAQTVTGVVLTVTPSLPVGALAHTLTGTVLTVTPTLPIGSLALPQTVTGLVLTITPTLPVGLVTTIELGTAVKEPTGATAISNKNSVDPLTTGVLAGAGTSKNSATEIP